MFGAKPPPAATFESEHILILIVLLTVALTPTLFFVQAKYKTWIEAATRKAFEDVDYDKSGSVDGEELYSCVISIYLTLNQYGLYVIAPERSMVDELMHKLDAEGNGNGTLDYPEFARAIKVLTAGALSRCATTVVLTAVCPPVAAVVLAVVLEAWEAAGVPPDTFPLCLRKSVGLIPFWTVETTLTTLLLMLRPLAQDAVDALARKAMRRPPPPPAAPKKKKVSRTAAAAAPPQPPVSTPLAKTKVNVSAAPAGPRWLACFQSQKRD